MTGFADLLVLVLVLVPLQLANPPKLVNNRWTPSLLSQAPGDRFDTATVVNAQECSPSETNNSKRNLTSDDICRYVEFDVCLFVYTFNAPPPPDGFGIEDLPEFLTDEGDFR